MNVVSERLNWRASACMVSPSRPWPSSNTASGLPVNRPSRAKTLTMRYAYWRMGAPRGRLRARLRWGGGEALEQSSGQSAEGAVRHHKHVVARPQRPRQGFQERAHVDVGKGARAERRERVRRVPSEVL